MRASYTLCHYSKLDHLPSVMREGSRHGFDACPDTYSVRVVVSLTTQSDSDWIAVRYLCDVARDDPPREPWRRLEHLNSSPSNSGGRSGYRTLAGPELTLVAEAVGRERHYFPAFVTHGEPFALDST